MQIKGYGRKYPSVTKWLHSEKVLLGYPKQILRDDLQYDEGIDIVYYFKGMTPAKFAEYSDYLLLVARQEAERYKEEKYKFAKFDVEFNRTTKGRKALSPVRSFVAAKNPDPDVMVYGEAALGYMLPEEIRKKPFLVNKVQEILDFPLSEYPTYVEKQRPYKVLSLTISIRAGLKPSEVRERKEKDGTK